MTQHHAYPGFRAMLGQMAEALDLDGIYCQELTAAIIAYDIREGRADRATLRYLENQNTTKGNTMNTETTDDFNWDVTNGGAFPENRIIIETAHVGSNQYPLYFLTNETLIGDIINALREVDTAEAEAVAEHIFMDTDENGDGYLCEIIDLHDHEVWTIREALSATNSPTLIAAFEKDLDLALIPPTVR